MKICIDPGHGGSDFGAAGMISVEKDINLRLALFIGEVLSSNNIKIIYTREKDEYVSLQSRCSTANKHKCDFFISLHSNASKDKAFTGMGAYFDSSGGKGESISTYLLEQMINFNNNKNRGAKAGNFYVLKNCTMPACLFEIMYITNPLEEKQLNDEQWQKAFAKNFAYSLMKALGVKLEQSLINDISKESSKTAILGEALISTEKMETFLHEKNPKAPYLAKLYISIGKEEGVKGDIAFAQALVETDYFKSCTDTGRELNNFANIPLQGKDIGQYFETPVKGIKAHIQHLKALSSIEKLNTDLVDPTFHLVQRGTAQYWEELDDKWFSKGEGYGYKVIALWREMLKGSEMQLNEIERIYQNWVKKGVLSANIDLNKPLTMGEFLLIQNKLQSNREEIHDHRL